MEENVDDLTEQIAQNLLNIIAPDSLLTSITVPDGSFSNYTHIVSAKLKDGSPYQIVVRRYKVFGDYDRAEKARREFKTFQLLNQHQVPAPEVLYLDETGGVLGIPGIVTRFVEGKLIMDAPSNPLDWARKLAKTLAKIHSIPCKEEEQKFLLRGNEEATWFLKYDAPPKYMQEYPGGADLWHLMKNLYTKIQADVPVLLHIDYWSGNILWDENEISAVIDWEEAAYGDPAVDVAYARMNMILMGLPNAADEFLQVYEAETGRKVENLGFWELAAAIRPMTDPADWKVTNTEGLSQDIFQQFMDGARSRVG
ncbi:MAG: phosphotransferase [Anaerolineales bacterium]|nr:phosphotransferase [Anaerolineales bacterium]